MKTSQKWKWKYDKTDRPVLPLEVEKTIHMQLWVHSSSTYLQPPTVKTKQIFESPTTQVNTPSTHAVTSPWLVWKNAMPRSPLFPYTLRTGPRNLQKCKWLNPGKREKEKKFKRITYATKQFRPLWEGLMTQPQQLPFTGAVYTNPGIQWNSIFSKPHVGKKKQVCTKLYFYLFIYSF